MAWVSGGSHHGALSLRQPGDYGALLGGRGLQRRSRRLHRRFRRGNWRLRRATEGYGAQHKPLRPERLPRRPYAAGRRRRRARDVSRMRRGALLPQLLPARGSRHLRGSARQQQCRVGVAERRHLQRLERRGGIPCQRGLQSGQPLAGSVAHGDRHC